MSPEFFTRRPKVQTPSQDQRSYLFRDSDFLHYMNDFNLIDRGRFNSLLETRRRAGSMTMIDLLAYPDAIRSLKKSVFSEINEFAGLSVGMSDSRSSSQIDEDSSAGITHITGDLNKRNTWDNIEDWLGGKKAHLIIERGFGGLHFLPTHLPYYKYAIQKIWDMTSSDGGMVLLQIPPKKILEQNGINISRWINLLRRKKIYRQHHGGYHSIDGDIEYGLLQLIKNGENQALPII
ncbi:MAG: hypothetical protein NTV98_00910 [Candidatus Roizmanbacteria bacterium]|nr:hypothetical protein [Candidatus Roizmanbacteria bacterium]